MNKTQEIVLASVSPRRIELLKRFIPNIVVKPADICEDIGIERADELVCELARRKAAAVSGDIVIGADTVVSLDNKILGKPADERDAACMLRTLSGREHEVFTGICVRCEDRIVSEYVSTRVAFKNLSDSEIAWYIATREPLDKAGAYGIQGYGAIFVSGINGDYYNVMGLPVCRVMEIVNNFMGVE